MTRVYLPPPDRISPIRLAFYAARAALLICCLGAFAIGLPGLLLAIGGRL